MHLFAFGISLMRSWDSSCSTIYRDKSSAKEKCIFCLFKWEDINEIILRFLYFNMKIFITPVLHVFNNWHGCEWKQGNGRSSKTSAGIWWSRVELEPIASISMSQFPRSLQWPPHVLRHVFFLLLVCSLYPPLKSINRSSSTLLPLRVGHLSSPALTFTVSPVWDAPLLLFPLPFPFLSFPLSTSAAYLSPQGFPFLRASSSASRSRLPMKLCSSSSRP